MHGDSVSTWCPKASAAILQSKQSACCGHSPASAQAAVKFDSFAAPAKLSAGGCRPEQRWVHQCDEPYRLRQLVVVGNGHGITC